MPKQNQSRLSSFILSSLLTAGLLLIGGCFGVESSTTNTAPAADPGTKNPFDQPIERNRTRINQQCAPMR